MPSFLPKQLTSLVGSDSTLARVNNNVRSAVQPTLEFLQTYFSGGADGTLRLLRNTVAQGAFKAASGLSVVGSSALTGDTQIYGNVTVNTRTGNGFIIVPSGGSPAFFVTNPANTAALLTIDSSGNIVAPSVASGVGFPEPLYMGTYMNTSNPATTPKQTVYTSWNDNGSTLGQIGAFFKWPRAGSVVGYSYRQDVTGAGQNTMYIYKNGSSVYGAQTVASAGTIANSISKGTVAFAANDELSVKVMGTTANQQFSASVTLMIEMAS